LELLKGDAQLAREYGEPLDLEFARHLKESGVCQVLSKDEKENKTRAQAEYNGKKVRSKTDPGTMPSPDALPLANI
jgi:hypothetical protein